jgi:Tfp pilus assembly protein PilN
MLVTLSQTIPSDVWITQFSVKDSLIEINGSARDYGLISDFMQKLGDSAHYKDLTLKSTDQERSGSEVATFELAAKKN